jgi:hypothetical protein
MAEQIPLGEALICVNCDTIFRVPGRICPHCTGESVMPLAAWLDREPEQLGPASNSAYMGPLSYAATGRAVVAS